MHPKFTVLVHFGAQFTARKPKILPKTSISEKTASFEISNNISPRSQKHRRIFVKLSKKNVFGPKLGLNCPLDLRQRVITNSHIAYNGTIHLYFLDAKFQLLGISHSRLYPEETTMFFGSGPNWVILGGLRPITPVNNVRLS